MPVATSKKSTQKLDSQKAKIMIDAFDVEYTKSKLETLHYLQDTNRYHARAINIKMFKSVLEKCEQHASYEKVVNMVAIYRLTLEMFSIMKNDQFKRANEVLDEIDNCLRNFDKNLTLPERKLSMKYIFN